MSSTVFHELAARGAAAPLCVDLYLHEESDPEAARRDGARLARVIERAARHARLPIAVPLMDLTLDKADLLAPLDLTPDEAERFQFPGPLDEPTRARLEEAGDGLSPGSRARDDALCRIARETDLFPIGLVLGPFSLATKLMADPITAAALLGSGVTPEESPQVALLRDALEAAERTVLRSARRQIEAGARAIVVCEPTACTAYLSPRQIRAGSPVFERLVIEPNLRLRRLLAESDTLLFFHDCGELVPEMLRDLGERLRPAVLSLGSSRRLWEDADLVPESIVLYGNLPSKTFYSDEAMPLEEVHRLRDELVRHMRRRGRPFLLGSECDVLHVPGAGETIRRKVEAILTTEAHP